MSNHLLASFPRKREVQKASHNSVMHLVSSRTKLFLVQLLPHLLPLKWDYTWKSRKTVKLFCSKNKQNQSHPEGELQQATTAQSWKCVNTQVKNSPFCASWQLSTLSSCHRTRSAGEPHAPRQSRRGVANLQLLLSWHQTSSGFGQNLFLDRFLGEATSTRRN